MHNQPKGFLSLQTIPRPHNPANDTVDAQDVAMAYLMGGTFRVAQLYASNPITPETSLGAVRAIHDGGGDAAGLAVALTYIHSPGVLRHGMPEA